MKKFKYIICMLLLLVATPIFFTACDSKELADLKTKVETLEEENNTLKIEKSQLQTTFNALQLVRIAQENEIADLEDEIEGLEEDKAFRDTTITDLTNQISTLEDANLSLLTANTNLNIELNDKTAELTAAEEDLAETNETLESKIAELSAKQTELTETKAELQELETQIAALEEENENLETEKSQLQTSYNDLQLVKNEQDNEIAELDNQIEELESDIDDLNETITSLNSTITTLQNSIDSLQTEKTELNNQLTEKTAELTAAKEDLAETNATLESKNAELSAKQTELTQTKAELQELETQIAALEEENENLKAKNDSLKETTSEMVIYQNKIFASEENEGIEGTPVLENDKTYMFVGCTFNDGLTSTAEGIDARFYNCTFNSDGEKSLYLTSFINLEVVGCTFVSELGDLSWSTANYGLDLDIYNTTVQNITIAYNDFENLTNAEDATNECVAISIKVRLGENDHPTDDFWTDKTEGTIVGTVIIEGNKFSDTNNSLYLGTNPKDEETEANLSSGAFNVEVRNNQDNLNVYERYLYDNETDAEAQLVEAGTSGTFGNKTELPTTPIEN